MPPDRRTWGIWGYFGKWTVDIGGRGKTGTSSIARTFAHCLQDIGRSLDRVFLHGRQEALYWPSGSAHNKPLVSWYAISVFLSHGWLTIRQIVGGILTGLLAVACGWMGEKHHIGFTVSSRFSWGMQGSYFPVVLRVFVACMWFGMQAFWGGQATRVLWGAIIPGKPVLF